MERADIGRLIRADSGQCFYESDLPTVDAIIATTCELRRWDSLLHAIRSLQMQNEVAVNVHVVVNGNRFDLKCLDMLKAMTGVHTYYQAEGNLALALCLGRSLVRSEFFCFLDDDDEYLPGAMRTRLEPMLQDASVDFVASNGLRRIGDVDTLIYDPASCERAHHTPLKALSTNNWLASCGGMFRTRTVEPHYFEANIKYFEWTVLAYRLANDLRSAFVNHTTFRVNDTSHSMSKTSSKHEAELKALRSVLTLNLPDDVRYSVREKFGRAAHNEAEQARMSGDRRSAWRHHLASLVSPRGWRYLAYTRKLIF